MAGVGVGYIPFGLLVARRGRPVPVVLLTGVAVYAVASLSPALLA